MDWKVECVTPVSKKRAVWWPSEGSVLKCGGDGDFGVAEDKALLAAEEPDQIDSGAAGRRAIATRKAWELSMSPLSGAFRNGVMLWMMGSNGFFGFILLGYAVLQSVLTLVNGRKVFEDLQKSVGMPLNLILQRLVYYISGFITVGWFLYQAAKSGILPIMSVDFGEPLTDHIQPVAFI